MNHSSPDVKEWTYQLNSGYNMPMIGFGTFRINGYDLIKEVLDYALAAGYRRIDTAAVYNNEKDIGKALKKLLPKYNLSREDIFITSKLSPSDQGEKALNALDRSVRTLDCKFLDLYLIHWPGTAQLPANHEQNKKLRFESWKALIQGKSKGLTKSIGVSNFLLRHLNELLNEYPNEIPAVNQIEWHPHCHNRELKSWCEKNNVLIEAYSSLGGTNNKRLIQDPYVVDISTRLDRSPAQVLLRWALQNNIAIIPKSTSKKHIEENINLNFLIPNGDMDLLNNMLGDRYAWDPNRVL